MENNDKRIFDYAGKIWGTQPPTEPEKAKAKELLPGVPDGLVPIDIARYFLNLNERNADGEAYNAEWKNRSNPLIMSFFSATDYGEATDTVAWCAAFMNWCLRRAGREYTNSAMSGSFRCFGDAAAAPKVGDIAVFKNAGENQPCSGHGHVAFWMAQDGDMVTVLGGNQGNSVSVRKYPASAEASAGTARPWLMTIRTTPID